MPIYQNSKSRSRAEKSSKNPTEKLKRYTVHSERSLSKNGEFIGS